MEERCLLTLSVIPVPYVQSNPEVPHPGFEGANTTLKAIIRSGTPGHTYKVTWDANVNGSYTDDSSSLYTADGYGNVYDIGRTYDVPTNIAASVLYVNVQVVDQQTLETDYSTYAIEISDLTPRFGVRSYLTGETYAETWTTAERVLVQQMALDENLWYVHRQLIRAGSGTNTISGNVPSNLYGSDLSPLALSLFASTGHFPAYAPGVYAGSTPVGWQAVNDARWATDPYAESSLRLANFLASNLSGISVNSAAEGNDGRTAIPGTDDLLGYRTNLYLPTDGYRLGHAAATLSAITQILPALSDTSVQTGIGTSHTWQFVAQQIVDGISYQQIKSGPGNGGWYFDNIGGPYATFETTSWAIRGLMAADTTGAAFGVIVNQDVKYRIPNLIYGTRNSNYSVDRFSSDTELPGSFTFTGGALIAYRWLGIQDFLSTDTTVAYPGFSTYTKGELHQAYDHLVVNPGDGSYTPYLDQEWFSYSPDRYGFDDHFWSYPAARFYYYTETDGAVSPSLGNSFAIFWHAQAYRTGIPDATISWPPLPRDWERDFGTYVSTAERRSLTSYADFGSLTEAAASSGSVSWTRNYFGTIGTTILAGLAIVPELAPVAKISVDHLSIPVGQPITFDGRGSYDLDPSHVITVFSWESDGYSAGNGSIANLTFVTPGTHTVTLTVTDNASPQRTAKTSVTIKVTALPANGPMANAGGPYTIEQGTPLQLSGSASDPNSAYGDTLTLAWDLDNDGVYNDASGVSPFISAAALQSLGLNTLGIVPIRLRATDSTGRIDIATTTLTVSAFTPHAVMESSKNVSLGTAASFNGLASSAGRPDGRIVYYRWDFGDGESAYGSSVSHNYAAPGTYTASLSIQDDYGRIAIETQVVSVIDTGANLPPQAVLRPVTGTWGQPLVLDASRSFHPDSGAGTRIVKYQWDLNGDGTFDFATTNAESTISWAQVLTTSPTLTDPRTLSPTATIILRVTDNLGTFDTVASTLSLYNDTPVAIIDANGTLTTRFDASRSYDGPQRRIVKYEWDYDYTGSFTADATGISVSHSYASDFHTTALRVTDDLNHVSTTTITTTGGNWAPPVSDAGGPYVLPAPISNSRSSITLNATGSFAPNAPVDTVAIYQWDTDGDGLFGIQDTNGTPWSGGSSDLSGATVSLNPSLASWPEGTARTIGLRVLNIVGTWSDPVYTTVTAASSSDTFVTLSNVSQHSGNLRPGAIAGDNTLTLSGTASGGTVLVQVNGTTIGSAQVSGGLWNLTTPSIADGKDLLVTATIAAPGRDVMSRHFRVSIDTGIPAIVLQPNELNPTLEATSPNGTLFALHPTATDILDPNPVVTQSPNLSVFPLGTTNITITAIDWSGNVRAFVDQIKVRDTIAPTLFATNVRVEATSPTGAFPSLNVTASDLADSDPLITSTAPVGEFPIGDTPVTFTATDDSGNHSTTSIIVTVLPQDPPEVSDFPLGLASGLVDPGVASFHITFDQHVVNAWNSASYELRQAGSDGVLDTTDDQLITLTAAYTNKSADLTFPPLQSGTYRLTIADSVTDVAGNALDGDANRTPGSNWVRDFMVGTLQASIDGSGNLTINDTSGKNNTLTAIVYHDGVNDFLDITDPTEQFVGLPLTTPASSLTNDGKTLRVPLSAITGSITVNGGDGNDTLTVDLSAGDCIPAGGITFNGGESSGDVDSLKIIGYSLTNADGIADVTVTHTGADAGDVVLDGLGTVSFTQTEPLTLSGNAADLMITLPSGADSVTLGDDGVTQDVNGNTPNTSALYDATGPAFSFEFTEFTNPTNSLKINRGGAADDLTVLDLVTSAMTASLNLGEAGSEFNEVAFAGPIYLASNKNLSAFATGTISLPNTASDLATTGTGAISLTTARNITVSNGASITTVNGNLNVNANQQFTPTAGSFTGIDINGGLIQATGVGTVTVQGRGGNGGGGSQFGIHVSSGGDIIGGTSGLLTVQGTGGLSSGSRNYGVYEDGAGSTITSSGGNVAVTGNGSGVGGSDQSFGILLMNAAEISAGGSGLVNVIGNAGAGDGDSNYGIYMLGGNAQITSSGGSVSVTGTGGGSAGSSYNAGVVVDQSKISAGENGSVTVAGVGGNLLGTGINNYGVLVLNASSGITSAGGDVAVTGTEGGGSGSVAILLTSSGAITTAANGGNITLAGDSMNLDPSSTISTVASGSVLLRQLTDGVAINLGTAADPIGGPLGLSDAELDRITAGTVQIGNGDSGTITVTTAITHANNLLLTTPAGIVIEQAVTMAADKNLTVTSTGATLGIGLTTSDSTLSTSGTGSVSVISTRDISLANGSSITTADGVLNVQANQQFTPTAGSFTGIDINGGLIQATGVGTVTVQGRGGNGGGGSQFGIHVSSGGDIIGGTSGLLTVQGTGGLSSGGRNYGVYEDGAGSTITSSGGNVAVTGNGSGVGGSDQSFGILLMNAAEISAGGSGLVNVIGNAGAGDGDSNYGIYMLGGNAQITSSGGSVSVTGTGGGSAGSSYNAGVVVDQSKISAGENGSVTVAGVGGNLLGTGINNYGVLVVNASSGITSAGGDVAVTGTEGGGSGSVAILLTSSGAITTAANGGNITLAGDSMNLDPSSTISTVANDSVFLRQLTNGVAINLGTAADPIGGPLGLSDAELDRVFAGTINIGDTNSGRITVSDAITSNTNLSLTSGNNGIAAETAGTLFTSGAAVTLNTTGPIGTAVKRIQFADNPDTTQQNVIVGSTNQADSVFLDGLGSLTLGSITGDTANTTVDVTARANLTVASGATLTTGTGTQILGANLTAAGASSGGTGTLTISNSATVTSTSSAASAITLLGADQVLNGQIVATGHTVTLLQSGTEGFNLGAVSEVLANTVELSDAELNTIWATKLVIGNASAGSITISRALDLTDAPVIDTLHLISGNQVLESGAEGIKVANLAVEAIQDITLDSANNDVAKLALQTTGTSASASYVDANGFIVANVDDVDGINVVEMTTLKSGSNVTQTAPVVSTSLLLTGQGNYDLNGTGNDVDTLAAIVTNRVYFSDVDDLTIGTVGPTSGTSSSELNAHAATIVVFEPIIATMSGGVILDVTTLLNIDGDTAGLPTGGTPIINSAGPVQQTGAGGVELQGKIVTTNANVSFASAVRMTGATVIDTGSGIGNITFSNTLNGTTAGVENLTLTAGTGNVVFAGQTGSPTRMGVVTINSAANVTTNVGFSAATFKQTAGSGTTTINGFLRTNTLAGIDLTSNYITLNGVVTTTATGPVKINNASDFQVVAGAGAINSDGPVTQTGAGLSLIGGSIVTTDDAISFASDTYISGTPVTMNAGNGNVSFAKLLQVNNKTLTLRDGNAVELGTKTTIANGTLNVYFGDSGTTPNSLNIGSGETFTGTGTVNATLNVGSGATLAPSSATTLVGTGILTFNGDVNLASGSAYNVDLNGTTVGTGYDQVIISGAGNEMNITAGAVLQATRNAAFSPTVGTALKILDGINTVNGTFTGAVNGTTLFLNGAYFTVSYNSPTGDLVLTNAAAPGGSSQILDNDGGSILPTGSTSALVFAGTWTSNTVAGRGFTNDLRFASPTTRATPTATATYTFTGLTAGGTYRISTTWFPQSNRATNAPFTISDGVTTNTILVNQVNAPSTFAANGAAWQDLAPSFTLGATQTALTVTLGNQQANGYVIADAVRIEAAASAGPEVQVLTGSTDLANNAGTVDFGTIIQSGDHSTDLTRSVTIKNVGSSPLILGTAALTVPTGYQISGYTPGVLAPGAAQTLQITLLSATAGNFAGSISFQTNDSDENPFTFKLTGSVVSEVWVVDNKPNASADLVIGAGVIGNYSESGTPWNNNTDSGVGFMQDLRFANAGAASTATWSFSGLTAGTYRVSVNYRAESNRASNAMFTVSDGTGSSTVQINQRNAPNDFLSSGVYWEDLVTFYAISGSELTVTLNAAGSNGYVIADAVRIEHIDAMEAATGQAATTVDQVLSNRELRRVANEAIDRWKATGLTDAQLNLLNHVEFHVQDLPGAELGAKSINGVYIDPNAAGYGWFIDKTPRSDREFRTTGSPTELLAPLGHRASGKMDLLTVVMHELGHIMGMGGSDDPTSIMAERLSVGTRRIPTSVRVAAHRVK